MNKLTCYGITARALQVLLDAESLVHEIPCAWFNWVGVVPDSHHSFRVYAPRRVQVVSRVDVARWCKNSLAAGYDCVYIGAIDDTYSFGDIDIDIDNFEDSIEYTVVAPFNGSDSNHRLLTELREPDEAIVLLWDSIQTGGGGAIEEMGFASVTPPQWNAYGECVRDWIRDTESSKLPGVRVRTPDLSKWNPWEHLGGPSRMLDLTEHFDTPTTRTWPWSVKNPITKKDVHNLGGDIEAFWPMRQMPFCGVARIFGGELRAIGALPNRKVNGNWLWDDGSIFNALNATAVVTESLLQKVLRSLNSSNVEVSSWRFPTRGRASSRGESGRHELENGEIVEINWNDDMIEVSHVRTSGTTHDLWLIAVADTPDGGELLGSWKYAVHDQVFSPGINSRHQKVNLTFIISSTEFRGI